MKTKLINRICSGLVLLTVVPAWAQVESAPKQPVPALGWSDNSADANEDRMLTPPPVSGQNYPTTFSSEERSNYLRGGLAFTTAYSDNALGADVNGHPVSDVSYSVAPTIALDETTPRLHSLLTYAPGFTFYQHTDARNETDQNAFLQFEYRLSPHLTFSALDSFQKSSNVFNQPDLASAGVVSGGTTGGNFSVIAPIADRLTNSANVGLTYQFSLNSLVGASGSFTNLHYPDPTQVPGLYDASSQAGSAFYSFRVAKRNYVGAIYQYQRLVSYPTASLNETDTHAVLFFYTLYTTSKSSISFFGGPQHSDTLQPLPLLPLRSWTPAAGASVNWQGRRNSFAMSYAHTVASGGGLIGAVQLDSASASFRQQIYRTLTATVAGGYAQNDLLGALLPGASNGHSISATALLQQMVGQHVNVQLGYTRLHQNYSNVSVLSTNPDTNREVVSISYQFSKALGR